MQKRVIILIILIAAAAFVLSGCLYMNIGGNAVVGNGQTAKKTVTVENEVTGLNNTGSIDVVIDPQLQGEAVIEGESNIIDFVKLEQSANGALTVSFKDNVSVLMSRGVTVTIPAVNGGDIVSSGSGNIKMDKGKSLKGDSFRISVEGSGDILLTVDAANLEAQVEGSGNIDLTAVTKQMKAGIHGSGDILMTGYADSAEISVNGSGDFDGLEFALTKASISGTGSGNINVNVSDTLSGNIHGSGDVVYSGDPHSVTVTSGGSGDVIKR